MNKNCNRKKTIAYLGNVANIDFREVRALQNSKTITAHLYLVRDNNDLTRLPESDDPSLKNNYPNWIFLYDKIVTKFLALVLFWLNISNLLRKHNKAIIEKLNSYDLVILSGEAILLAPFITQKTIFRVTGSDLTVYPLFKFHEINLLNQVSAPTSLVSNIFDSTWWFLYQKLWKEGILQANFIDVGFGKPFEDALNQLKHPKGKRINFLRLSIDVNLFRQKNETSNILKKWKLCEKKFIVFQPSRQMIRREPFMVRTGQWKASDNGIKGFKLFLDRLHPVEKKQIALMIPERNINTDLQLAKQLIIDLGIEENVIYLSGENKSGLSRYEMIDLYSISNVVCDDFGAGWYGAIAVEALACSAPLVTYVPDNLIQQNFSWHPFLIAQTPVEIADAIHSLYLNKEYEKYIRKISRKWAIEYHSYESVLCNLENNFLRLIV